MRLFGIWILDHSLPLFLQLGTIIAMWYVYKHRQKLMISKEASSTSTMDTFK